MRNTAKGDEAAATMTGDVEVRKLDLQDLASVREFADGVDGVDVLVNNAGIMAVPYAQTVDGFESQIGTNHLGHFALTNLLLPKITERVVTVSSLVHLMGYISLKDLNWKSRPYSAWLAYGQSKLANLLFTSELQRRLDAAGSTVKAHAAHPGYSATNLQGTHRARVGNACPDRQRARATDADFGARQTLYAVAEDLPGDSFIGPRFAMRGPTGHRSAQPAGPRRQEGRRAVGAIRAAHGHQIRALRIHRIWLRPTALAARRHGEGGSGHRYRREPASDGLRPWPCPNKRPAQEQHHMAKTSTANKLTAAVRTETGKGASRRARRNGKVPAVLYGHGSDPQHLELDAHDFAAVLRHSGTNAVLTLDIEGKEQLALTKALEIHPIRRNIQHADLLVVRRGEKVTVEVNVVVEGEAVNGTLVTQDANTIEIEADVHVDSRPAHRLR